MAPRLRFCRARSASPEANDVCRGQRRRAGDPQCPCAARRPAARQSRYAGSDDRADRRAACARRRSGDERGSLYDRGIAALAIKQARGDLIEAIFLVRAYRTTLPRFGFAEPLDTAAMTLRRRVSATFKDLPGGQVL